MPASDKNPTVRVEWDAFSSAPAFAGNSLLTFAMEDKLHGIAASSVVRVIEMPSCIPVPDAQPWFKGLFLYEEEPLPVIDLAAYYFRPNVPGVPAQKAMIVKTPLGRLIFTVQRIEALAELTTNIEPPEAPTNVTAMVETTDDRTVPVILLPQLCQQASFLQPTLQAGVQDD